MRTEEILDEHGNPYNKLPSLKEFGQIIHQVLSYSDRDWYMFVDIIHFIAFQAFRFASNHIRHAFIYFYPHDCVCVEINFSNIRTNTNYLFGI